MPQRLNGWQRLWFVMAILGLLYAAWFALADGAKHYGFKGEVLLEFDMPECKAVIVMPAGHKLSPGPGLNSPCWNLYRYRSNYSNARSNPQAYVEHMGSLQRSRALETFGFTFVVWLVSFSLLYLAGKIAGWVFRFFFRKSSP
jgi:hypothetical protein